MRGLGEFVGRGLHRALLLKRPNQQVVQQSGGDKVEHDRCDHDVAAPFGLQIRRDRGPCSAKQRGGSCCANQRERPMRPRNIDTDQRNTKSAQDSLTFASDIEHTSVEGDGHGKPGKHKVRGVIQRIAPAIGRPQRAIDHQFQRVNRAFPNR